MSRQGMIKDSNTRYPLTLDRDFKSKLQEIAAKESISLNKLIVIAIEKYVSEYENTNY